MERKDGGFTAGVLGGVVFVLLVEEVVRIVGSIVGQGITKSQKGD